MTDFNVHHPSADDLIEFAEGRSLNAKIIELHIDLCADCAEAILTARKVRFQVDRNLIPPLSSAERAQARDRLNRFVQSGKVNPNTSLWGALGAMGAASIFSPGAHGPMPLLAGRDDSETQPEHKDDTSDPSQAPDQNNIAKSGEPDVTPPNDSASSHQTRLTPKPDELDELLNRMDRILDAPHDTHESNGIGADEDTHDHAQFNDVWSDNDAADLSTFDDPQQQLSEDEDFNDVDDPDDAP